MANPDGKNQGPDLTPYGDVKKQTQLTRAAPMSGAPFAGSAVNAARRAQHRAVAGGQVAPAGVTGPAPAPLPGQLPPAPDPQAQQAASRAMVWSDLAATPGASDLVKAYAAQAQREVAPQ